MKKSINFLLLMAMSFITLACANVSNSEKLTAGPTLTVTEADNGFDVAFSGIPSNTFEIKIFRTNLDTQAKQEIFITWFDPEVHKNINDVFVNKGQRYSYQLVIPKISFESKKSDTMIAKNGLGELKLTTKPQATYDEKTTNLTFQQQPGFSAENMKVINANNWHPEYFLTYSYNNLNFSLYVSDTVNCLSEFYHTDLYGEPFTISDCYCYLWIQNSTAYRISSEDLSGLPSSIVINDIRPEIKLETSSTSNGVKVTFDTKDIPEGTNRIYFGRRSKKYKEDGRGDMPYWYSYTDDLNLNSITDYFTTPNDEYEYTVIFDDKKGNTLLRSKPATISALSGLGNGLKKGTKLRYDKEKNTSTISPMPNIDLTTLNLNEKVDVKYDIRYENEKTFAYCYLDMNDAGVIEWGDSFNKYVGVPLYLSAYSMRLKVKNVTYRLCVYTEELKEYLDKDSFIDIVPSSKQ